MKDESLEFLALDSEPDDDLERIWDDIEQDSREEREASSSDVPDGRIRSGSEPTKKRSVRPGKDSLPGKGL